MAQFSVGIDTNDVDPNHPIEASRPHPITPAGAAEEPAEIPTPEPTESGEAGGSTATAEPTENATPAPTQAATQPAETPAALKDVVAITSARHRLNKDMTISGTSKVTGTVPAGSASVTLYDASPGRSGKLGVATINALGSWSLTAKPGPGQQVTSVRAESSRGGTATRAVDTR